MKLFCCGGGDAILASQLSCVCLYCCTLSCICVCVCGCVIVLCYCVHLLCFVHVCWIRVRGANVFMSAFNVLSIPTFLPFLKYVSRLKSGYENDIKVDIPYVRSPGFLDAKIASDALIKEYLHPCIPYMEEKNFNNREKAQMKRIVKDLDLRHANSDNWKQEAIEGRRMFYEWIQQYDKRRDLNFLEVFPQMEDFYEECKKCMI